MEALKNNSIKYARRRAVLYVVISMYLIYKMHGSDYKILFLLPALFFIGWAVLTLYRALSGKYQKEIHSYVKESANPTETTIKIDHFLANTPSLYGVRCNKEFFCLQYGIQNLFRETSTLVWVYKKDSLQQAYFLVFGFSDGKLYTHNVENEEHANEILAILYEVCPQTIFDYNKELATKFKKNLNEFLEIKYNKYIS